MYITICKKHIILTTFICIFLALAICLLHDNIFASKNNWGLSFKEKGVAPNGNATADFLEGYNAYYIGNTEEKKVYLTFDAGYENGNMPKILESLKKHDVKATFFVVSTFMKTNPELVKQIVEDRTHYWKPYKYTS